MDEGFLFWSGNFVAVGVTCDGVERFLYMRVVHSGQDSGENSALEEGDVLSEKEIVLNPEFHK